MRNLKRVLSLALALVMILGMMVMGAGAASADFSDAAEIDYTEAVDVISGLGVMIGSDDNGDGVYEFEADDYLQRDETAKIMCYILMGKANAEKLPKNEAVFADVAAGSWAAGFISYCNNLGIMVGDGKGNFDPDGQLTGVQFAKMLLVAAGYDPNAEGYAYDKNWAANIGVDAIANGLDLDGVALADALTREQAAQMIFQALNLEMVKYRTSYDYATGAQTLVGPYDANETFMGEYFPALKQVKGVITAIDGKVKFDNTEVKGADADWTDTGYQAYVWALESTKEKKTTLTAISDVIITGESLYVGTNGIAYADLTNDFTDTTSHPVNHVVDLDTGVKYYYNGELLAATDAVDTDGVIETAAEAAALVGNVGTKVDFIDNDNEGKAEAVVVTTYTAAQVTKVIRKSVSGVVSDYKYVLDGNDDYTIKAEDLANVDGLEAGDYIAYTEVGSKVYVTVLEAAEGKFNSLTREKLNTETTKVYTIDGEDYIASEQVGSDLDYLIAANTGKDYIYVTDMYGYLVRDAEIPEDPDDYLFVLDNEDSHGIKELAETEVAYADGTVEIVDVACGEEKADDELAEVIYKYEVKGGAYTLTPKTTVELADVDYTTKSLVMDDLDVTTKTVLVDLRAYLAGDADEGTVYVGYKKIPSFVDGTVYCLVDNDDIVLAFLTAGKDPAAAGSAVSFVVFNTEMNVVSKAAKSYELTEGVLVDGDISYEYVLTAEQRADILTYGVGVYGWDKNGELDSYVSFAEDSVFWTPESSGELYKNNKNITDDYKAVYLNIAEGEVNDWWEIVDDGEYYAYFDEKNDVVYIVADDEIGTAGLLADDSGTPDGEIGGKKYWSHDGDVTAYDEADKAADDNLYSVTVKGVEAVATGEGKGTAADPIVYTVDLTATQMASAEKNLVAVADYVGNDVTVVLSAGNKVNEDDRTAPVAADWAWTLICDGVYYQVEINVVKTAAELISAASAGDTVVLPAGEYANLTITKNIVIDGSNGAKLTGQITLSGAGVTNVTIQNCEIEVEGSTMEGCVVSDIAAASAAVVTITNNTFTVAEGKTACSAIYLNALEGRKFIVTNNTFSGEYTEAAISVDTTYGESVVEITGNDFTGVTGKHLHVWNVRWTSLETDIVAANMSTGTY